MFKFHKISEELKSFRPLGKSGLQVLSSSTLIKSQGLLIAIIFTTQFGLRGYGFFQFVITTVATLAALSTSGLPSLLSVAFAANLSSNIPRALRTRFTIFVLGVIFASTILTLTVSALYGILIPKISLNSENYSIITRSQLSLLIIFWTPVYAASQLYTSVLLGLKEFNYLVRCNIFRFVMYLLIWICKVLFIRHLFTVLCLIFLIDFIFLLLQGLSARILIRINRRDLIAQYFFMKRIKYGKFILLETALANTLIVIGLWTLQRFLASGSGGYVNNGYFGIILRLVSVVNFIPTAYSNILIPFFAKEDKETTRLPSFKQVISRSLQILSLWLFVFIVASYLFAPYLSNSLGSFGRELVRDRWIVFFIATSQVLNTFTSNALLAAQKFRIWIKSDYILGVILLGFVCLFRNAASRLAIVMWATVLAYGFSGLYALVKLMIYFRKQTAVVKSIYEGEF